MQGLVSEKTPCWEIVTAEHAPIFLRKNRKSGNGEVYEYWTLSETVRTELGPRQRVVATLGKLTDQNLAAVSSEWEVSSPPAFCGLKPSELWALLGVLNRPA